MALEPADHQTYLGLNDIMDVWARINIRRPSGPETHPEIRSALEASRLFVELVPHFSGEINPTMLLVLSERLAAIRRLVYQHGLRGGPGEIRSVSAAIALDDRSQPQPNSLEHRRLARVHRTVECLLALGGLSEERQSAILGPVRARMMPDDPSAADIEQYADAFLDGGRTEQRTRISEVTPTNELLQIIAFTEDQQYAGNPICQLMRRTAHELLIRRLMTTNEDHIRNGIRFLTYRHYKQLLEELPDALSSGKIGGKAAGLIIACAALEYPTPDFDERFAKTCRLSSVAQLHDAVGGLSKLKSRSVMLGSDLLDVLLENNASLAAAGTLKHRYHQEEDLSDGQRISGIHQGLDAAFLTAEFPSHIVDHLRTIFMRFHGKPIVVRSSSALEDRVGASFAGLYDSVHLPNCSDEPEEDFAAFLAALLRVYRSVFDPEVLKYRRDNGLILDKEEMGILIQEASGEFRGDGKKIFFPDFSGVVLSQAIRSIGPDPNRGAVNIAAGLGSLVVDQGGRYVMFDNPHARLARAPDQSHMGVIQAGTQESVTVSISELFAKGFLTPELTSYLSNGTRLWPGSLTGLSLDGLFRFTPIAVQLEYLSQKLAHLLGHEVDLEITGKVVDFESPCKLSLIQCRPLNIAEGYRSSQRPPDVPLPQILFESQENMVGLQLPNVQHLLYIDPRIFQPGFPEARRREIVRLIPRINQAAPAGYIIFAPRRWGSSDTNAGLPVVPGDFSNARSVIEMVDAHSSASFGNHFDMLTTERHVMAAISLGSGSKNLEVLAAAEHNLLEVEIPPHLSDFISFIDVEQAGSVIFGEDLSWRLHLAGNCRGQTPEERVISCWFAPEDEQLPETIDV